MKKQPILKNAKYKVSYQAKPPKSVRWGFHPSPYDPIVIGLNEDNAICVFEFQKNRKPADILKALKKTWPKTEFAEDKTATGKVLKDVLEKGAPAKITMTGTKFQQDVWKTMLTIPAGKTLTYAEVAKRIKRPKAVRAVGSACGANPVAVLVPCHRIIGSNGGLGGFGGGLPLKREMLEAEGVKSKKAA